MSAGHKISKFMQDKGSLSYPNIWFGTSTEV